MQLAEKEESRVSINQYQTLASKVEAYFKASKLVREKYEKKWYLNDNFYHGHHFVRYNRVAGTIDRITPPRGTVLRAIPKAMRQIESMVNIILSNDPRPSVSPKGAKEIDVKAARRASQFLENIFDDEKIDEVLYEVLLYGLIFPVSFLEVGYDEETGRFTFEDFDAFDIYLPPGVKKLENSPYIIKAVPKRVEEILDDYEGCLCHPGHDLKQLLVKDNKQAASDLKQMRISEEQGKFPNSDKIFDSIIVKEMHFKTKCVQNEEGNYVPYRKGMETDEEPETKVRIVTTAGSHILNDEISPLSQYTIRMFKPRPGPVYQEAVIERFMSINKSLDVFVSSVEEYAGIFAKGKILVREGDKVTRYNNEHGQIIRYTGNKPEIPQVPSLPAFMLSHQQNLEKWMEEFGVSSVAFARVPAGVKAARAIEALKGSDYSNNGMIINAVEKFLERICETILDIASVAISLPQSINAQNRGKPEVFNVIGAATNHPFEEYVRNGNVTELSSDFKVRVQVEDGIAHTPEGRRATLKELYAMKLIPPEMLLEQYKFGNLSEIMEWAENKKNEMVSMIDTPDFNALPAALKKQILMYLANAQNMQQNPIAMQELNNIREDNVIKLQGGKETDEEAGSVLQ